MKNLDHIEMSKLDFIRLIADLSSGKRADIKIGEEVFALNKIRKLHLGSVFVIFESDGNKNVQLEMMEGSEAEIRVSVSDTNFDEYS